MFFGHNIYDYVQKHTYKFMYINVGQSENSEHLSSFVGTVDALLFLAQKHN